MASIEDLLRVRYPANTHALLFEVRNAAGFAASRACDALAMGLWPSRGLKLEGFEIKRSRADWLKEYRTPEKADAFAQYCDRWWLVVSDAKIVEGGELPETWGLLVAKGARLVCEKEAPPREVSPLSRSFLAALLKRAIDQQRVPAEAARNEGIAVGRKQERELAATRSRDAASELAALKKRVLEFETASGLSIMFGDVRKLGDAVRMVQEGAHHKYDRVVANMLSQATHLVAELERMQQATREPEAVAAR